MSSLMSVLHNFSAVSVIPNSKAIQKHVYDNIERVAHQGDFDLILSFLGTVFTIDVKKCNRLCDSHIYSNRQR